MSRVGQTSNHGMSEIDVHNELVKSQRKLLNEHKGLNVNCPKCRERFSFKGSGLDLCHVLKLEKILKEKCPMCSLNHQQQLAVSKELLKFNFNVLGHDVKLLRIPYGFRPMQYESEE
jgi:hypothetical protein